jgi:serine/threonine-protein kinase
LAGCLLLVIGLVAGGLWLRGRQVALVQAVEEDLRETDVLRDESAWAEAGAVLERAKGRLGKGGPAELRRRVEEAGRNLDQARRDQEQARRETTFAARLDAIRLARATRAEGHFNTTAERRFTNARADHDYEVVFREAGFEEVWNDPAAAAARLIVSPMREALVAGVTDWAVCAGARDRQDWLLAVARHADPDPWRDRVRDAGAWRDGATLAELARVAPVAGQATPLLIALGERVEATGGDATGFLRRVYQEHPADFWANMAMGRVLREEGKPKEAAACYREAEKIRPGAAVYINLGLTSYDQRQWDEAIKDYRKALKIDPRSAPAHNNIGLALKGQGPWNEAIHHYRLAVQLDPGLAPAHCNLGVILAYSGRLDEAIEHFREALRFDPGFALAHYHLGVALLAKDRFDAAKDNKQQILRADPTEKMYNTGFGASEVNAIIYYHRAIDFDPGWSLTCNGLGLTRQDQTRLDEAIDHYNRALGIDPGLALAEAARGRALMTQGRFREARDTTRKSLDLLARASCRAEPNRLNDLRPNVAAQLQRCERLMALESRLPAIVERKEKSATAAEDLEFAELCGMKGLYAASARLYADGLAAAPLSADNIRADHRYKAGCVAALAGCGRGADADRLGEADRIRWRRQARDWLRAELGLWARIREPKADRELAELKLAHWWIDPDLAVVRDPTVQAQFSPAEREEWDTLWNDFDAVLTGRARPAPQPGKP